MWCVAELNDQYKERMEDVLEVYERPRSSEQPVVGVDEKSVTLRRDVRAPLAMKPGSVARRDCEYERCGTANAFCGVEPKAGVHFTQITPTRSSWEFAGFLHQIACHYPQAETIHLVMDNLSSHTRKAVVARFGENAGENLWNRFTVHYTPKHGSWLNQAEIEISLLARQTLRKEARAWNLGANRKRVIINWTFDRKKARKKFRYRYKSKRSET
jgi:transposase